MIMIVSGLEFCFHCSYLASYAVINCFHTVLYTLSSYIIYSLCDALQENDYHKF